MNAKEIEEVKKQIESIGYEENNSKDAYTIFKPLNAVSYTHLYRYG